MPTYKISFQVSETREGSCFVAAESQAVAEEVFLDTYGTPEADTQEKVETVIEKNAAITSVEEVE